MILAAPLVIPFAEAIGLSVATLGIAKASDMVNEFIQENPEQSMKIFQMIMPSQGIANALKNKSSEGDEEVSEDIDVEVEEKPKKLSGKEKGMRIKEAIRRARAGKGNYSSPDAEGSAVDIRGSVIREVEDMGLADKDLKDNYDPDKPKFDYKKFFKKRYADGGSIGIEVLFEPKREKFNTGGTPYDARASAVDYATALDRVGAGTNEQKRKSLSDYLGNAISTQGQKIGNVGTMALQGAKGVLGIQGTPITDSMQTSLQNIIQNQIKNSGKLSGNINYNDYGVKTGTQGKEFLGFGDRSFTDPEAALATTLGKASYVVDPKTGKVTFTGGTAYDFGDDQFGGLGKFISKGGVFNDQATQYNPNISLGSDFINQSGATMTDFQKYKTTMLESLRKNHSGQKTAMTDLQPDGSNSGPARALPIEDYFNYMFADKKSLGFDPATGQKLADGGRVGLFMGGDPLTGQALSIYDSMKAYNFSDQEIANALSARGLSELGSSTPETTAPNIINSQINQGGGGGGGGGITQLDPLNTRTNIASGINRNNRSLIDPLNEKIANQMTTQNPNLNKYTTEEIVSMNPNMFDIKTNKGFIGNTIDNFKTMSGSLVDKFSGLPGDFKQGKSLIGNIMDNTIVGRLAAARNPLNPKASNYSPDLQGQMDFLEGKTGSRITGTSGNLKTIDGLAMIGRNPNSGLSQYGPGSVLSGQNVVSGFGTNNYEEQLQNYVDKMRARAITKTLSKFQEAKLAAGLKELKAEQDRQAAALAETLARVARENKAKGYKDYGQGAADSPDTSNMDAQGNYDDRGDPGQTE